MSGLSASQIQFASSAASVSRQFPFSFPGALLFDAKRGTTIIVSFNALARKAAASAVRK